MIHFTCDRCQRSIEDEALRYVVKMEIAAEFGEYIADESQQLEAMQEILSELDEEGGDDLIEDVYRTSRFDLCSECYHQFKNNPLNSIDLSTIRFSQN